MELAQGQPVGGSLPHRRKGDCQHLGKAHAGRGHALRNHKVDPRSNLHVLCIIDTACRRGGGNWDVKQHQLAKASVLETMGPMCNT